MLTDIGAGTLHGTGKLLAALGPVLAITTMHIDEDLNRGTIGRQASAARPAGSSSGPAWYRRSHFRDVKQAAIRF